MRTLVTSYSFNKATKQVTFSALGSITLERVLLIVDQTAGVILFQPNDPTKGGTASSNVLTLAFDTTGASFANTDKLQIFYEADTQDVSVTNASIAVTGTVTANLGTIDGVATSALQTTGNSSLSSIDGKVPALGQALAAGSTPVVLPSAQITALTPPTSVGVTSLPALSAGSNAIGSVSVSNFPATQPVSGTVTANAGTGTFAVSAASLPLPSGAATSALQTTGNSSLSSIDGKTPALGQATMSASQPVTLASDQPAVTTKLSDSTKATYSATSAIAFASAATATDIFTITGSATKTVKIVRIGFSGTQTTAATNNVLLIRRSTANTAGTSAAATAVPHDSTDAAATATVLNYTANPTLGTVVATVRANRALIPATNTAATTSFYEYSFGDKPEKQITLRGTGQVLAINLNSTTLAGGAFTCFVEWTEE